MGGEWRLGPAQWEPRAGARGCPGLRDKGRRPLKGASALRRAPASTTRRASSSSSRTELSASWTRRASTRKGRLSGAKPLGGKARAQWTAPPDAAGRGVGEGLSFALQMDHFVSEVCMAGAEPRVTFRQALMVNLLADAAIESKRLGQFVDFKRFAAPKLAVAGFPP